MLPRRGDRGKSSSARRFHDPFHRDHISKKVPSRGGKASRKPRAQTQPYTPVEFTQNESLWFNKSEDWDSTRLVQGIRKIVFGNEFDIADLHVEAIIAVGPDFCHSLQDFRAGDSETGRGGSLRDAAIVRFAAACPNLVHVQLDGGRNLGDSSLLAFFNNCPNLRYIQVSGNDRCTGDVQGSALDELRAAPERAKKLEKIRLTDQLTYTIEKPVKNLSVVRKKLVIELGETRERGSGVHTWLEGKKRVGYQAFGGPGGFSQYGGW